jgi:hypothetical protein
MPTALPDGVSPYSMKLLILGRVAAQSNRRMAKSNIVGRTEHDPGDLERVKGWRLTDEQRGYIYQLIQDLCVAGFFRPSFGDLGGGENWCVLTEAGQQALERGVLDNLDGALKETDPALLERRQGAWAAYHSGRPDSLSQAAASARELLTQTLRTLAPNEAVQGKPWYQSHGGARNSGGVTRGHRIRFIIEARGPSDSRRELAEASCDLVERWNTVLSGQVHNGGAMSASDVKNAIEAVENTLRILLLR